MGMLRWSPWWHQRRPATQACLPTSVINLLHFFYSGRSALAHRGNSFTEGHLLLAPVRDDGIVMAKKLADRFLLLPDSSLTALRRLWRLVGAGRSTKVSALRSDACTSSTLKGLTAMHLMRDPSVYRTRSSEMIHTECFVT